MNTFQLNRLSYLHNNHNIFFCKTDYLNTDFDIISQQSNDVILISGNSDYPITDEIVNKAPKNIKKWFCQNAISNNPILEPIPLGLENELFSNRDGHGVGYPHRAAEKDYLILNQSDCFANRFIYANFNIHTNITYRDNIKNFIQHIDHIEWEDPILSLSGLFSKFLSYKMVLCPIGNGIDTHRLWEVLYLNRVPITIKTGDYRIYELYKKFPIIILESINELKDYNLLNDKYNTVLNTKYDKSLLYPDYWINFIKRTINI